MICRDCDLLICQHCFDRIYHGRKLDYIHRHPLVLTVRTNWYCIVDVKYLQMQELFFAKYADLMILP